MQLDCLRKERVIVVEGLFWLMHALQSLCYIIIRQKGYLAQQYNKQTSKRMLYVFLTVEGSSLHFNSAQFCLQYFTPMNLSLFGLLILTFLYGCYCELKPQRMRVVDSDQKGGFLIRGNLPIKDARFQMDQLQQQVWELTGMKNYELVVVSFLNFLTAKETKNRYIEEKYFDKHPKQAEYRTWFVLGALTDPLKYPPFLLTPARMISSLVDVDRLDALLEELREEIDGRNGGVPRVVFMHCSAGMDRTGLVAGAYKMKYLGWSMKEVLRENAGFGGPRKEMMFNALNGLKWYCLSIRPREQCIS